MSRIGTRLNGLLRNVVVNIDLPTPASGELLSAWVALQLKSFYGLYDTSYIVLYVPTAKLSEEFKLVNKTVTGVVQVKVRPTNHVTLVLPS